MSGRQIEACAARLPQPQRSEFEAMMRRAAELGAAAGAMRSAAWAMYRSTLGVQRRIGEPTAKRQP